MLISLKNDVSRVSRLSMIITYLDFADCIDSNEVEMSDFNIVTINKCADAADADKNE